MRTTKISALLASGAIALCIIGLRIGNTQSGSLRRVTSTTEEGININPSISGDGRVIAFESTEDVARAGGSDHFRAIRANLTSDPAAFFQMGGTRAVAPAISQDGSRIAFASKDDPLGTNLDGNSEIFLFDGVRLTQVTNTSPGDVSSRTINGNFQPSISDDGRFIAFSSNRDLAGQNADGNLEIFIYDTIAANFNQLTNSSGIVGFSDAKLSGNGGAVAYIRDSGASPSGKRDLLKQPRAGLGPITLLAPDIQSLAMTYGRAISDDGSRVVYAAETAANTTQVFLFDGRSGNSIRQVTNLGARATEVPLHPTISGDGTKIAFAARRSVPGAPANSDGGVELYVFDIPTAQMSKVTNGPSSATADVLSSLSDDGSVVAFSFPRILSGSVVDSNSANNSEIYVTGTPARPLSGTLTTLNGASFGKEPSTSKAIAPDSIAVATGGALANSTEQAQKLANGTFPTIVGGTTVTVNGRAAQIFFVSPAQVNFLVPPQTESGTADVSITNSEGFVSKGTVPTLRAAPGVFAKSGDGTGPGVILNSDTLQEGPFDPTNDNLRLTIFATGVRNASQTVVSMGGRVVNAELVMASPDMPGLDEVHVVVPNDLRGAGTVDLFVQSDGRASNPVSVTFAGDANREIAINEVLADPPAGIAGDANHDGAGDTSQDEFVEFVNATTHDLDIGGYQLLTRGATATNDTLQFTFTDGTILPACAAVAVFGGGTFDPANPVFGGALVFKASGLSLGNAGGVVTLKNSTGAIVTFFSYGGSTGLNGQANQSLTRSPDVTGAFALHQSATGSGGKPFSPGTRVNGDPFTACPSIARIDITPPSATIDAGAKQQFTAQAFDSANNPVTGVIFSWQSSNTGIATIDQNGLATSTAAGTTEIRATARGRQSDPATLTVRDVQHVLTRIDVTPSPATIPATGAQQFTAHGIDQFGNEIAGLTLAWESSDTNIATIDQTGLANGIAPGQSIIKATSQSISGTATLNVSAPTVVVNEVLADPPTGTDGDANHDGTRDSAQDEFVELVNSTGSNLNISGWTLRTHSTSSSNETVRHAFAANTTISAGEATVIFGGGTFNPSDPIFGCAQVLKASSGGLSLTNGGLTILVRDNNGNLVTQFSYGGTTGLNGGNAQSLSRSPDVTGNFVLHTTIAGARRFSPGLKVDGTPFANCTLLSINDVTANEGNSGTATFTFMVNLSTPAPPGGVTFDIATHDNTATIANNDYVARSLAGQVIPAGQTSYSFDVTVNGDTAIEPNETFLVSVTNVSGALVADGQGTGTITNDDSPAISINDVAASEGNAGTKTFTFTVTSSLPAMAGGITFDIATADGTATNASGDYVSRALTSQTIPAGQTSYSFDVTVNGDTIFEPNESFLVNVTNVSGATRTDGQGLGTIQNDDASNLVISQTYPGGGLSGASFANDFIEIFNRGTATVDFAVTPYSVQFLSTGGSTWAKTDLTSGTVAPGRYFLIKETGGANGAALPAADATGTLNLTSTTPGKVALVLGSTLLTGNCPGDDGASPFNPANGVLADFVGYGGNASTANQCYEGSGPASFTSGNNTIAAFRKSGGCTDTDDNVNDTFIATPFPRNSSSPPNNCAAGSPPNLTINDVTVIEGNSGATTATFTVSLSAAAPTTDITFDIATQNNTATTANNDYAAKSLTSQIIPAGQTSYTFSVTVNGDVAIESDETFFVNVTNVTGATVTDGQGLGTITNDDLPTLSINDVSANEGNSGTTTFSFTVNLSAPAPAAVTFDIATADNTATLADNDYVARSLKAQTISAGQSSYTFDVMVNGDVNIEPNETFLVNVTNLTGAVVGDGSGQGTIQNDDSPVLNINDVAISEGNSGTSILTFTVTSTLPAPAGGIRFDIATADNTATTASNDYVARSLTSQTIPATQTTYTFDITINGDLLVEPNEKFFVNLSNASGATIGDGQGQGTITNDDTADLRISQVYGGGNNSGAPYQNDFVEIFNHGTTTVDFSLTNYSVQYAGVGSNFGANKTNLTSGTIASGKYFLVKEAGGTTNGIALPAAEATGTIAMGNTSGRVALVVGTNALSAVTCPGDDLASPFNPVDGSIADFVGYGNTATTAGHCYEGAGPAAAPSNTTADFRKAGGCTDTNQNAADFFVATPSPRNSSSPANNCTGVTAPNLSISDVTLVEGNSGIITANFTVTLDALPQGTDVTFDIATQDNSATTANSDYVAKTLTNQIIPAGQTTYVFRVVVNSDMAVEPDESFFVNVTNVAGAIVSHGEGTGTIQNDDLPALSITDLSLSEGHSGTTAFTFTVHLSAPAPAIVSFDIATQDNTATTADNDYVARSLTGQTIAAGLQDYQFTVNVNGDTTVEANESFFVNVTNVTGATVTDGQGLGTIQNDDSPVLSITSAVAVAEGNSGTTTATFTVTLSPAINQTVTVDFATANETATAGSDYLSNGGTLTFNPLDTTKIINVTVNGDILFEADETFTVTLSNASANAAISPTNGTGTGTITNDDTPLIVISQIYGGGGNAGAQFKNDFIEVFNRGTSTVDLAGWSVQETSATGTSWSATPLCPTGTCLLTPGKYFLVQEASGGAAGSNLPAPDAIGTISLAATAGKVALVNDITPLSGGCPTGVNISDFVGYGTTADCFEGSNHTGAPSNTSAEFRKSGGCTDTNDNAADFVTSAPNPRNKSAAANVCTTGSRPDISISDVTVTEGDSGTVTATFNVTLSAASAQAVTVAFATADGTATVGSDYQTNSGTLTFNPGDLTKPVTVLVSGDTLDEANETFFVNLTNPTNAAILDPQGQGTITDNDPAPSLSINDLPTITEGNSSTSIVNFTISLSTASGQTVTVNYATADGTANSGSDYVATSGTLTFNPGDLTRQIPVTINGDTAVELNETFFVNLTSPANATLSDGQGQGTIINDDAAASVDLAVTKSTGSVVVVPGNNISYTIALTNNGPDAAVNPNLSDTLPPNTNYQSIVPPAGWTCITPAAGGAGTITCSRASMAASTSASFPLTLQVNGAAPIGNTIINTAQVTNDVTDPNNTNDSSSASVSVVAAGSADLKVTKTDSPDPVYIGSDISYSIVLTNNGPATASSPQLTDTLPTGTTFRSLGVPASWTCITPSVGATGSISCSASSLNAGSSVSFPLVVRVGPTVSDGTTISNTASASSATTDSISVNNSATTATLAKSPLLITQIYPGGGGSGASFTNDFIEILNRGTATIDFAVTPYSVQFLSTGAAIWVKTDLSTGTIAPGQYFLIQEASGGAAGSPLPTPDATGALNLTSTTPAKVALVSNLILLTGNCPGDDAVSPFNPAFAGLADFVGYAGTAATANHCYEGSGPAPFSTGTNQNARSTIRTSSCTDTKVNSADFNNPANSTGTTPPVPRNKATATVTCP